MLNKIFPIFLGILLIILIFFLQRSASPLIENIRLELENILYDSTLMLHINSEVKKSDVPITIVDIDDTSIVKEGRWPWPRNKVATLLKKIQEAGAVVVAFDVIFSQPEENSAKEVLKKWQAANPDFNPQTNKQLEKLIPEFDFDKLFADRLAAGESVLGFGLNNDPYPSLGELPPPILTLEKPSTLPSMANYRGSLALFQKAAKNGGFVTVLPDQDGTLRHIFLLLTHQKNVYATLALEAVRRYLLIDKIKIDTTQIGDTTVVQGIQLGETRIPTDADGEVLIPFFGPSKTFPYVSATDLLNDRANKELLANAIVFVGSSSDTLNDLHATPLDSLYPGIEIHASIARALIDNNFPYSPDWSMGAESLTILLIGVFCTLIFPFVGALTILSTSVLLILGLMTSYSWLLQSHHILLSITFPILLILSLAILNFMYGFFSEVRLRRELKDIFGQYLPASRVELMSQHPKEYSFEGESKNLTVLFADIRSFTTLSESMTAVEVRNLLNRYFTRMTEIIFKHKGTIDKYVGDMIMAFWGAPEEDEQHAKHALAASVEMIETTEKLKAEFAETGLPPVSIGIGLNTGDMYVGDMGSKFRRAYTVLGDKVNLASRLQDLSKFYYAKIVVGEATRQNQDEFVFRKLDKARVKGKKLPVEIFEVLGYRKNIPASLLEEISRYETALENYFSQNWDQAEEQFNLLIKEHPDDLLYVLYLNRIKDMRQHPVAKNWDGVFKHTRK